MKKYFILFAFLLSAIPCFGAAQLVALIAGNLSGSNQPATYTVPVGKILVIDAVSVSDASAPSTTGLFLVIRFDNSTLVSGAFIEISNSFVNNRWNLLPIKIRLKAGDLLSPPTGVQYRIMGTLIDEADLYAVNLPVELNNPRVSGGKLMADAKVASPRPHKITIQSSTDLSAFTEDTTGATTSTGDPTTSVVSVDQGTVGKKFIRVMATTRK